MNQAVSLLGNVIVAFSKDVSAQFLNWLDKYRPEIYAAMAIGSAALAGPKAMAAAGAAAYGYGLAQQKIVDNPEERQRAINDLKEKIAIDEQQLKRPGAGALAIETRPQIQARLNENKRLLALKESEVSSRQTGNVNRVIGDYNQRPASVTPTAPQRVDEGREGRDRGISPSGNSGAMRLDASQREMADLIYSKFTAAGFTPEQANAAIVNALAESSLNPRAANVTSSESSYGLFQANTRGGLGTGHDPEKLKDPNYNIDLMINAAKSNLGMRFRQSRDLETAIRTFTEDLERPANKVEKGIERVALANRIGLSSGNLPETASPIAAAPKTNIPGTTHENTLFSGVTDMMASVFSAMGDMTRSVQQIASAPTARSIEQSTPIPSPYDSQLFESLLMHHSSLGSSISGS
jgi:hypothetical protein